MTARRRSYLFLEIVVATLLVALLATFLGRQRWHTWTAVGHDLQDTLPAAQLAVAVWAVLIGGLFGHYAVVQVQDNRSAQREAQRQLLWGLFFELARDRALLQFSEQKRLGFLSHALSHVVLPETRLQYRQFEAAQTGPLWGLSPTLIDRLVKGYAALLPLTMPVPMTSLPLPPIDWFVPYVAAAWTAWQAARGDTVRQARLMVEEAMDGTIPILSESHFRGTSSTQPHQRN